MDRSSRLFVQISPLRRVLWILGLAAVVGGILLHLTHVPPDITLNNYEQIAPGMTVEQVTAILGAPPGGYGMCWCDGPEGWIRQQWTGEKKEFREWVTKQGAITVSFTAESRACGKAFYGCLDRSQKPRKRTLWTWMTQRVFPRPHGEYGYVHF